MNLLRFRALILVMLTVAMPCERACTQSAIPLAHQSWSTEEGLPQASVQAILQGRDGFLWLATEGGAVRYDGVSFRVYNHGTDPVSFVSNDVTSLVEDRAGNVWLGTADGLIQEAHGKFQRFAGADGLPAPAVIALALASTGQLQVETEDGLSTFDGLHLRPAQPAVIGRALRGPDGKMWRWTPRSVLAGSFEWRVGRELPGVRVQAVFVDRQGIGWIGTNRGLVTVVPGQASAVAVKQLGANSILSLLEDTEGDMWVGTETSGLHALRPRKFRQQAGLEDEEVSCGVTTSDGAVWIGTREDGTRRVQKNVVERPLANDRLTSPVILAMAAGLRSDLWIGTPDGLNHVEANGRVTRYTSSEGLPDDLVRSLHVTADGSVWVGTRRGLAHLHNGRIEVVTKARGLGSDLVGALFSSNAELWVATLEGVSVIGPNGMKNYGRADGLSSNLVTSFAADAVGRVWISTRDAGLFLFNRGRFLQAAAPGLPGKIFKVLADREGNLWLRGERGIVRAQANALESCAQHGACDPVGGLYGTEDGMPSGELVQNGDPVAWQVVDGELWFATRKGVAIANPAALAVNRLAPPVAIERFLVDSEEEPIGPGRLDVPSGHARYTFEFAALSFVAPSKVLYQSRLVGFDKAWSPVSGRRNTSYTNLPSGLYTFRVRAMNNDGVWNQTGAAVEFRVLPPIYRRWWFVLLLVLGLAGLAALLYRLRVRRLQRSFDAVLAERNRMAREIHDTLAQDFVGVALQLDLVGRLLAKDKVPEAATQLQATRSYVKTGLEEARQSIWNLRADVARGSLPSRITSLVKASSDEIPTVKAKIGGAYRVLPPQIEDEVVRIIGEAVSNATHHAKPSLIVVDVNYAQDKLVVRVEDDGCGFYVPDGLDKPGHYGLRGMQERAAGLGTQLNLTSIPGEGTKLELRVPIAAMKGMGH